MQEIRITTEYAIMLKEENLNADLFKIKQMKDIIKSSMAEA